MRSDTEAEAYQVGPRRFASYRKACEYRERMLKEGKDYPVYPIKCGTQDQYGGYNNLVGQED